MRDPQSAGWVPRGDCGPWTEALRSIYEQSNLLITVAYWMIGLTLLWAIFIERKGDAPPPTVTTKDRYILRGTYGLFIVICGTGHLEGVLSFSWPNYPVFAAWDALTAAVSWVAVGVTIRYRERLILGV